MKKEGIKIKGKRCPVWGGLNISKSVAFFSGGLKDVSVTLLSENHSACVIEGYEEKDIQVHPVPKGR